MAEVAESLTGLISLSVTFDLAVSERTRVLEDPYIAEAKLSRLLSPAGDLRSAAELFETRSACSGNTGSDDSNGPV